MPRRALILRELLADPRVRRVELAYSCFNMAEYGVWVSVLVYAYEHGGATAAALIAAAQLIPAGMVGPLASGLADRRGGAAALRRGYWLQAGTLGMTSMMLAGGAPTALTYAAAILAASAVTTTRPAQAALVPTLVERSEQLTAINVLSGWVENASVLAGPALAGALIAVGGPAAAIGFFALLLLGAALLVCTSGLGDARASRPAEDDQAGL